MSTEQEYERLSADLIDGPVEFIVLAFEGNQFSGEIIPALKDVVQQGIIRVIDLVFIRKDDGDVTLIELENVDDSVSEQYAPLVEMISGLVAEEDLVLFAEAMEDNTSAAVLLFEHLWAAPLREAIVSSNGRLIANGYVNRAAVRDLIETYG